MKNFLLFSWFSLLLLSTFACKKNDPDDMALCSTERIIEAKIADCFSYEPQQVLGENQRITSFVTIGEKDWYAIDQLGHLYHFDTSTEELLKVRPNTFLANGMVASGDFVYVSSSQGMLEVNNTERSSDWYPNIQTESITQINGKVILAGIDYTLYELDQTTKELLTYSEKLGGEISEMYPISENEIWVVTIENEYADLHFYHLIDGQIKEDYSSANTPLLENHAEFGVVINKYGDGIVVAIKERSVFPQVLRFVDGEWVELMRGGNDQDQYFEPTGAKWPLQRENANYDDAFILGDQMFIMGVEDLIHRYNVDTTEPFSEADFDVLRDKEIKGEGKRRVYDNRQRDGKIYIFSDNYVTVIEGC